MLPADGTSKTIWPGGYRQAITNVAATADAAAATVATLSGLSSLAVVPVKTITGTTYTLVLADQNQALEFTNTLGCTVTIPANSSVAFPVGAPLELRQVTTGAVTVTPAAGVTVNRLGSLVSGGQWAVLGLVNRGTNLWLLSGDTTS